LHRAGCACGACSTAAHPASCGCAACSGRTGTALFADATEGAEAAEVPAEAAEVVAEAAAEVPAEVEAMDGVESEDEAHNVDRPARQQLKKKRVQGNDLSEFKVGDMVTGKVKSITNYGAFIDIGASTDGLLHISQLSSGYVANVGDILSDGQEVEVRLIAIDAAKSQVGLSLMTEEEEAAGAEAAKESRGPMRQSNRRDDSAALASLVEKGWDPAAFIEGTVVSTVDFGCFVRVDCSLLNSECEGELDGLVHISALRAARVSSVTDVVSVDEKVQIRVKSIAGNKVSLTMLSVAEETDKSDARSSASYANEGAKDWKESLEKFDTKQPSFTNTAVIQDRRK